MDHIAMSRLPDGCVQLGLPQVFWDMFYCIEFQAVFDIRQGLTSDCRRRSLQLWIKSPAGTSGVTAWDIKD